MPNLKEAVTFLAQQSLAAAASVNGPTVDLRERFGAAILGFIQNGGTGPGTPPVFSVQVSTDNFSVDVRTIFSAGGKLTANLVTEFLARIPPEILWARVRFDNTAGGQAVTVSAVGHVARGPV